MSKILTVANRVFWERILKPSYYWMIILPIILIFGAIGVQEYSDARAKNEVPTIAVVASDEIVHLLRKESNHNYYLTNVTNFDRAKLLIKEGTVDGVLRVKDNLKKAVFVQNSDSTKRFPIREIQDDLSRLKVSIYGQKFRLTQGELNDLLSSIEVQQKKVDWSSTVKDVSVTTSRATHNFSQIITIFLFFLLTSYISIAGSEIGKEKGNHILEGVVSAVPVKEHFAGKILGIIYLIIFQLFMYAVFWFIAQSGLSFIGKNDWLELSNIQGITTEYMVITILIMSANLILYILLAALLASFVSRPEDISQATSGVGTVMFLPYLISFAVQDAPNNIVAVILSYSPFSSYAIMPVRIASGAATYSSGYVSFLIAAIMVVILYFITAKVYANNIFNYSDGKPIKKLIGLLTKKKNGKV